MAEETNVNLRTVQRALASPRPPETHDERKLRRFIETFRNFATFCRENSPDDVGSLKVTPAQHKKLGEWNATVSAWMKAFNGEDEAG